MGFFDRHKALIITTLSMSILLLLLYNISIQPSSKNFAEMMVDLEHLELEDQQQESPEEERPAESQQTSTSSVRTHQAFNQQQEAREQNFEQRLNEIFERNSAQQEANEVDDTRLRMANTVSTIIPDLNKNDQTEIIPAANYLSRPEPCETARSHTL